MRKILVLAACGVVGLVGVARADKPPHPSHPSHPTHPAHPSHPAHPTGAKSCTARTVGYNAVGTLASASLSPATGTDLFSGTITVDITKANHHATTGSQSFTLTSVRVVFHRGIDATAPAAGSRVGLHGKITVLPKRCSTTGFTPTITIRSVDIRMAKP